MSEFPQPATRKRLRPKTYSIGLYVVGLFIALEIVALFFIFWIRQEVRIETRAPAPAADFLETTMAAPSEVALPNLPRPEIEARIDLELKNTPELDVVKLNEEARNYRRAGDFTLAEAALHQALELDADSILTLTNLAMLAEARGDTAQSLSAWKNVIRAGSAADGDAATVQLARERAKIIEQRFRLEEETRTRQASPDTSRSILTISKVETNPPVIPDNPTEIKARFSIARKPDAKVSSINKVRIQLYFYERTSDNKLVPAQITARFHSNPPDWNDDDPVEVLAADYIRSTIEGGERRYYGYLLRVFYNDQLQDERAEPTRLLSLFPRD